MTWPVISTGPSAVIFVIFVILGLIVYSEIVFDSTDNDDLISRLIFLFIIEYLKLIIVTRFIYFI